MNISIDIGTCVQEIEQMIARVEGIADDVLQTGKTIADERYDSMKDQNRSDVIVEVDSAQDGGTLTATGEDVLFLEFGTGTKFNAPHAFGAATGSTLPADLYPGDYNAGIGEYGRGLGMNPPWYYRKQKDYGNPACNAMGSAYVTMDDQNTVDELFGR